MTEIGPIVPLQTPDEEDRDALFFIERTRRAKVLKVTTVIELPRQCYRELSSVFLVKPRRSLAFWQRRPSHEYTFFLVRDYETIKTWLKKELLECISAEIRAQRRGALIVLVRADGVEVARFNAVFYTVLRALAHYDYKREEGRERWIMLFASGTSGSTKESKKVKEPLPASSTACNAHTRRQPTGSTTSSPSPSPVSPKVLP